MSHDAMTALNPVARFHCLCSALGAEHALPMDRAWLRFAAQVAALRPADPVDTASSIRRMQDQLRERCGWSNILQSSFGVMVAASLVQTGDSVASFFNDLEATIPLLREARLPHSQGTSVRTVLVLRLLSDGHDTTPADIRRLHAIYDSMRNHHWWLTGRNDLSTAALLTARRGDPTASAEEAHRIAMELVRCGLPEGRRLERAAHILSLACIDPETIAHRFLEINLAVAESSVPHDDDSFINEALLSLLPHPPVRISESLERIFQEIRNHDVEQLVVEQALAADLCFLDLVRKDIDGRMLSTDADFEHAHALIRIQRAVTVVHAQVPPTMEMPEGLGWPVL